MTFCEKCGKLKTKTSIGLKCQKCDDLSQIPENNVTENKIGILSDDSFPFELNKRYSQGVIRDILDCHPQFGISLNKKYNFFVLIRNAHKLIPNQSNVYLDRYDPEAELYYYTAKGTTGNQKLTGNNLALSHSKENNQKVHLFWERINGSDHHYVGLVQVENVIEEIQRDKEGNDRNVYVFTLKHSKFL